MKKFFIALLILLLGIILGFNIAVSNRVALIKSTMEDSIIRIINKPSFNQIAKKCEVPLYNYKKKLNKASLIVGHAYGSSKNLNGTISPNLSNFLSESSSEFEEIIFTGDVMSTPSAKKWKVLKNQLNKMKLKINIAPGNHDVGTSIDNAYRDIFFQEFDYEYPYIEERNQSIYIFLDSTQNPGKIDDKILSYLENSKFLNKTVFIFSHHLLRPNAYLIANSMNDHRLDINNIDILQKSTKNFKMIYLISGDSGLNYQGVDCLQFQNIFFISSGINDSDNDRALILQDGNLFQSRLLN